jgi:hypothetical protein
VVYCSILGDERFYKILYTTHIPVWYPPPVGSSSVEIVVVYFINFIKICGMIHD